MRFVLSFPGCHGGGGVERVMFECAHFLAGRGHEVAVLASEWVEEKQADGAVPIRHQRVRACRHPLPLRCASYSRAATRPAGQMDYDVPNTHGGVCPTGSVHLVHSLNRAWLERSRTLRGPLSAVRRRPNLNPLRLNPLRLNPLRLNPLRPVLLRLDSGHFRGRRCRKRVALTPRVKSDLARSYGVPPKDVIVNPDGFPPAEFSPERRRARRAGMRAHLGLEPGRAVLLPIANELERKGRPTLLAALSRLADPNGRLPVAGDVRGAQVGRQAAVSGGGDQVLACSPAEDMAGFHAAAELFVLPPQSGAFRLAILEASGSGLPVVTARVPGAQDAVQPGVNGASVSGSRDSGELEAASMPLLAGQDRAALSQAAPASVAAYPWPAMLARYEEVLRQYSR